METRTLGSSGIEITASGLGTNYVGGHNLYENVDEAEGIRLVQRAVDLGVTFIDTADVYGFGRSEELVGEALRNRRDDVVIATKGGMQFDGTKQSGISNDPAYLRGALQASLKRLGMDSVDLYYIHRPDGKTPVEDSFGELMRFKEEGLIRTAGVSNFEMADLQAATSVGPVDALQSRYNILHREVEPEILPFCQQNGISFVPWAPLAFGLLLGKYSRDNRLPEKDWRRRGGAFDGEIFERNLAVVEKLRTLATTRDLPLTGVAVQWLLRQASVDSVIMGAKSADQVERNVLADAAELTDAEVSAIDAMIA